MSGSRATARPLSPDQPDIFTIDPRYLVFGGGARFDNDAATLPELGGNHLHHFRAFDAFGVAGRVQMIGKSIGCEYREHRVARLRLERN